MSTADKIEDLLTERKTATLTTIAAKCGVSRSTAWRALKKLGAWTTESRWTLAGGTEPEVEELTRVAPKRDLDYVISAATRDDWIEYWETNRERTVGIISALSITPSSDPEQRAEEFAAAAQVFVSLSAALSEVKDRPDWYTVLGGSVDI